MMPGLIVVWQKLAVAMTPFYALAFFSFSITHSVEAVSKFIKKLGKKDSHGSHKHSCSHSHEGCTPHHDRCASKWQRYGKMLNPFRLLMRLISVPLKFTIFVLHNVAESLVNVKEGGLMGVLGVVFISIDDFLTEVNEDYGSFTRNSGR